MPSSDPPLRPPARRAAPKRVAAAFSQAIEEAERDGAERSRMTLRLTLNDVTELKRDRSLAVEDISFAAGVMRFMGVKVQSGGVDVSSLDRGAD